MSYTFYSCLRGVFINIKTHVKFQVTQRLVLRYVMENYYSSFKVRVAVKHHAWQLYILNCNTENISTCVLFHTFSVYVSLFQARLRKFLCKLLQNYIVIFSSILFNFILIQFVINSIFYERISSLNILSVFLEHKFISLNHSFSRRKFLSTNFEWKRFPLCWTNSMFGK